eukprot:483918-Rhodomonas_salina.1
MCSAGLASFLPFEAAESLGGVLTESLGERPPRPVTKPAILTIPSLGSNQPLAGSGGRGAGE